MARLSFNADYGTASGTVQTGDIDDLQPAGTKPTYSDQFFNSGPLSYKFDVTSGGASGQTSMLRVLPLAGKIVTGTFFLYITDYPTGDAHIIEVRTASGNIAVFGIKASNGKINIQDAASTALSESSSGIPLSTWVWVTITAVVGSTTSNGSISAAWGTGDANNPNNTQWSYSTSSANLGTADIAEVRFGKPNSAGSYGSWWDDVVITTPLTVDAGDDQNVEPYSTCDLVATSDEDEASIIWAQTSGTPTVTLTPDGDTWSFTVPALRDSATLTFQVTGDDGTYQATDTCDVIILPQNQWAVQGGEEVDMRVIAATSD